MHGWRHVAVVCYIWHHVLYRLEPMFEALQAGFYHAIVVV